MDVYAGLGSSPLIHPQQINGRVTHVCTYNGTADLRWKTLCCIGRAGLLLFRPRGVEKEPRDRQASALTTLSGHHYKVRMATYWPAASSSNTANFQALGKELTSRTVGVSLIGTSLAYQTGGGVLRLYISVNAVWNFHWTLQLWACAHCNIRPTVAEFLIPWFHLPAVEPLFCVCGKVATDGQRRNSPAVKMKHHVLASSAV